MTFLKDNKKLLEGELQRKTSYSKLKAENDMYITEIGQAVLELLNFKVVAGNHQTGIFLLQKFS